MFRIFCTILFLHLLIISTAAAQDFNTMVPKEIVILHSTKDYAAALKTAKEAAVHLGKKLDLESNHPNKQLGLSMTKSDCEANAYEYPCYTARGDGSAENSDFVSIEYSDAYEGFAKGYYIVVAAIGKPRSVIIKNAIAAAKKWYKDAYAKRTSVWLGCMH